jgi:hypothetical protein
LYAANQAGKAQEGAANQNAALQRQNLLVQLGVSEPTRALGYGAQSDLASLYGYNLPAYQSGNQLMNPGPGGSGPIQVNGRAAKGNTLGAADPFGIVGGKADQKFGGTIDPLTGTVNINNDPALSAQFTEYLRTGNLAAIGGKPIKKDQKAWRVFNAIQGLTASGWKYDPKAGNTSPVAGGAPGTPGAAGNMSRFFTSPDYQFRLNEGQRNIGNSFAARGWAASGNALRALTEFNQNTASSEYGNYTDRLLRMAGLGTVGNGQASNAANNYTQGMSNTNQDSADARSSGVWNQYGAITGGLTGVLGALGNRPPKTIQPVNSLYGPYSGGYQFPKQQNSFNYLDSLRGSL